MSTSIVRNKTSQSDLAALLTLGPRLIAGSIAQVSQVLQLGARNITVAARPASSQGGDCCCDIPETTCPPRCVCEIEWRGSPGEKLTATVAFKNTSKQTRNFLFSAAPFTGPGNPATPINVSPANMILAPGKSTTIALDFTPTTTFQAGQTYQTELVMRGAYEQAICIFFVPEGPSHANCSVEQGDPPTRLRAHQWYDHFQCTEPCFEEPDRATPENPKQPHIHG